MAEAFLETSALIEFIFGNRATREKVESCIPQGADVVSSRYVIYEMAKGFLYYLILLHNKSKALTKFSEVVEYSQAIRYKPHFQGAVLGSVKKFLESDNLGNTDQERLIVFRSFIRGRIRRGWREVNQLVRNPRNDIGCRNDLADPELDQGLYKMDLKTKLCGLNANCGVKAFSAANRDVLQNIRESLRKIITADTETVARIRCLRELYRNPKDNFDKSDCWRSGDALITVEAPEAAVLITKNRKHIEPVAAVTGQRCTFY